MEHRPDPRGTVVDKIAPVEEAAIQGIGLALLLINGVVPLGWLLASRNLVQPFTSFPPSRPALGVAMSCVALALLALARNRRVLGTLFSAAAVGIGGIALLLPRLSVIRTINSAMLRDIPGLVWGGGDPLKAPVASACLVLLAGIGVLTLSTTASRRERSIVTVGVVGTVILALTLTVALGRIGGFLRGLEYGLLIGASVQTVVSMVMLGTLFVWLTWRRTPAGPSALVWVPYAGGIASVITVAFLWLSLVAREEAHVHEQVAIAMHAARRQVTDRFAFVEQTVRRVAAFARRETSVTQFEESMLTLTRSAGWLSRVVLLDSSGQLVSVVPAPPDTAQFLAQLPGINSTRPPTRDLRLFASPTSAETFATIGACDSIGCSGTLIAQLNMQLSVLTAVGDTSDGFHSAVTTAGHELARTAPLSENLKAFVASDSIQLADMPLLVTMWPTQATMQRTRSDLPALVLVLGLMVSGLITMTLQLSQGTRRSAERAEQARFNLALGRATDGVWEWHVPTGASTRGVELWRHLGYDPAQMPPQMSTWMDLIHPEDRARVDAKLSPALSGKREIYEAEYRIKAHDGQWHEMIDRGRVVEHSAQGAPLRVLGISADITDRRRTERMLREMEALSTMGRLAARVAHEINNPLGGIQNAFMLVRDAIPVTHPYYRYVGAIDREIQRIAAITRQLYETYRPEQEGSPTASVHMVLTDAAAFLEQVNRARGVKVVVDVSRAPNVAQVPDALLRQCVYNLIQNSIEASPDGASVAVSAAVEGEFFVLRVRDHGPGVPAELREKIFEPFFSTKESASRTSGMGLGLSQVQRSVQSVNGDVTLREPEGGGAEFVVRFPLSPIVGENLS